MYHFNRGSFLSRTGRYEPSMRFINIQKTHIWTQKQVNKKHEEHSCIKKKSKHTLHPHSHLCKKKLLDENSLHLWDWDPSFEIFMFYFASFCTFTFLPSACIITFSTKIFMLILPLKDWSPLLLWVHLRPNIFNKRIFNFKWMSTIHKDHHVKRIFIYTIHDRCYLWVKFHGSTIPQLHPST